MVTRYQKRISGPLMDRIDIHVEVPAVSFKELRGARDGTCSSAMRAQVDTARKRQAERYDGDTTLTNGMIKGRTLRTWCKLDEAGEAILQQSLVELGLSARAHDRILRVSRTIADLDREAAWLLQR